MARHVMNALDMDKPYVEHPRDGHFITRHPNSDQVEHEGEVRDRKAVGTWRWYYADGGLRYEIDYAGGLKNGPAKAYFESGAPMYVGQHEDDLRSGPWQFFHENGAVSERVTYVRGKLHGDHAWDQSDGRRRARGAWDHGQRVGTWTWWDEPQYEEMARDHRAGAAHGQEWARYPGGQLAYRQTLDRGRRHGRYESWSADGKPTQRSTYAWSRLHGEHETWSGEEHTVETYWHGVPAKLLEDTKKLDSIAKKLKKAKDEYKKMDVLGAAVDWGGRTTLLVHLWRAGKVDLAAEPSLWHELASVHEVLEGAEVMRLLAAAQPPELAAQLPGWPRSLDQIAMNVALRDSEPFVNGWKDLAEPLRRGLGSVLLRLGKVTKDEVGDLAVPLATAESYDDRIAWHVDAEIVERELFRSGRDGVYEDTDAFGELLDLYTTRERFARASLDAALAVEYQLQLGRRRMAVQLASEEELVRLLNVTSLDTFTTQTVEHALLRWRDDAPEVLARVALATTASDLVKRTVIACAILRHAERGVAIPDALADALDIDPDSPSTMWLETPVNQLPESLRHDLALVDDRITFGGDAAPLYPRLGLQVRALRALGEERASAVLRRQMKTEYRGHDAIAALHTVSDEAVWREGLEAALASRYGARRLMAAGHLPARGLPLIAEALERETDAEKRHGLTHAALLSIARACDAGESWDSRFDALVRFDCVERDYDYTSVRPLLRKVAHRAPAERAEAILLRALEAGPVVFARAFAFIGSQPTDAVMSRAFDRLVEVEPTLRSEDMREIEAGLRALDDARAWIGWLLRSGAGSKLTQAFQNVLGTDAFTALKSEIASDGAVVAAPKDRIEQLVDQAARTVNASGKPTERIYLLRRRDDAPEPESVARIGGLPLGVDSARWPTRDDEPMTHLFTLDLAQIPELSARFGKRALSFFMASPDHNEAYEAGNDWTAVVLSSDEEVMKGELEAPEGADVRTAQAFDVVAVDVPVSVWSAHDDLYNSIYRASARVLGEPIWLQDEDEGDGAFVMQLDESFVDVNLGDLGVLYVFEGGAFWQCH